MVSANQIITGLIIANSISHRGAAMMSALSYLSNYWGCSTVNDYDQLMLADSPWRWVGRQECRLLAVDHFAACTGRWYRLPSVGTIAWRYSLDHDEQAEWIADYRPGRRHVVVYDQRGERGVRLTEPLDGAAFHAWAVQHSPVS